MEHKYCFYCMRPLPENGTCGCARSTRPVSVQNPPIDAGTVLRDRYLIGHPLGSGGFGITYAARDLQLDLRVAIKAFTQQRPDSRQQLLREARTMAFFSNDRDIVNVRDFFEDQTAAYIVMEYLDGRTLKELADSRGRLTEEEAVDCIRPVLSALKRIHSAGYVHRDVSPDNIMRTENGEVKLMDFGTTRDFSAQGQTVTYTLKPGYSAPEQYRGSEYQGPWTDLYSVCATLYRCVTGQTPADSLERTFRDDLKTPSELGIPLSTSFEETLMKGLSLDPEARFPSVEALEQALPADSSGKRGTAFQAQTSVAEDASPAEVPPPPVAEDEWPSVLVPEPQGRKLSRRMKQVLITALILVITFGAAFVFRDRIPSPFFRSIAGDDYIHVYDEPVTPRSLKRMYTSSTDSASLSKCELDQNCIDTLASMEHLERISFDRCTGNFTLEPLTKLKHLKSLSVTIDRPTEGKQLFGKGNPALEYLYLYTFDGGVWTDGGDFLTVFSGLRTLSLPGKGGIENLSFLSAIPALETLDVNDTDPAVSTKDTVPDSVPALDLSGDGLKPLGALKELQTVRVGYVNVTDLSPLSGLEKLIILEAPGNRISDLSPLRGCPNLYTLSLEGNQLRDISPLEQCPRLSSLNLAENQISDLSPLSDCVKLSELNLKGNRISDLSPLRGAEEILSLNVSGNRLSTLKGCGSMFRLTKLQAGHNQLTDIGELQNCTSLSQLGLQDNRLSDLSVLNQNTFPELNLLNLSGNQITSLAPLRNTPHLKLLLADHNRLTGLDGLDGLTELAGLFVWDNQLTSLRSLPTDALMYLDIGKNRLTDIGRLSQVRAMNMELLMDENEISDFSGLPDDIRFRKVFLQGNPIKRVAQLPDLGASSLIDSVYLTWIPELTLEQLAEKEYQGTYYLLDVPDRERARLNRERTEVSVHVQIMSSKEAAQEANEYRQSIRKSAEGVL